ncbi:GTP 3',8-cyclase MoaA [Acinetobacter sp. 226]|uniref:GTP 3',8-cyclase MoaA n=1 Tax=Acinetobacter sp. 226 TaxID=3114699 RepID=UPI003A87C6D5
MNSMTALAPRSIFQDQFGRQKRKLRISVTDRCNFKCSYCMPEHPEWMNKKDLLSFEALYAFCELMVRHGIEQIRVTGGEPLMRQGIVHFIAHLQTLKALGLKRISMTSNGHYLKDYAQALKQAGLDDLNISLDSLDPEQFQQLTKKQLQPVLQGIAAAQQAGLSVKINSVLLKGINDDQIMPLVKWAQQQKLELRFIEFMPLDGDQKWNPADVVSEQDILNQLKTEFEISRSQEQAANPARGYLVNGLPLGIISTITHSFCGDCDRLRLNAQGEFYNCLFARQGLNLKADIEQLARDGFATNTLKDKLHYYIWHKEAGFHAIQQQAQTQKPIRKISMHSIGG